MQKKVDDALYWGLHRWTGLGRFPALRPLIALTGPVVRRLFAGCLNREAARLTKSADNIKNIDPHLAQDLRLMAAEQRHLAHEFD